MAEVKGNLIVELYDLSITERKDDRFGRVVTNRSLNEDDLINMAVQRRTDLSPTSLKSTMELLKQIAREQPSVKLSTLQPEKPIQYLLLVEL